MKTLHKTLLFALMSSTTAIGFGDICLAGGPNPTASVSQKVMESRSSDESQDVDMKQLMADRNLLAAELDAQGGERLQLDLTKPVHYRFMLNRFKARGYTVENAPEVFTLLRAAHLGRIPMASQPEQQLVSGSGTTSFSQCDLYMISNQTTTTSNNTTYSMAARGGCYGGALYAYVDTAVYSYPSSDPNNLTLLASESVEQYDEGKSLQTASLKGTASISVSLLQDASMMAVLADGSYLTYFTKDDKFSPICSGGLDDPRDRNGDSKVQVCLGRSATDCDYNYANQYAGHLYIPISGRYNYKVPANSSIQASSLVSFSAKIHNPSTGAICGYTYTTVPPTTKTSANTLSFNLQEIDFGQQCATPSTGMMLKVNVLGKGSDGTQCRAPEWSVYPITFLQGCLKGDSLITLADGSHATIESLVKAYGGDSLPMVLGRNGESLRIQATSNGPEKQLIRVTDEKARVLELSPTHPLMTPIGPVQAEHIKKGDVVLTESGPASLTSVEKVSFDGDTYNLRVTRPDGSTPSLEESVFSANGILVGDLTVQNRLEELTARNRDKNGKAVLKTLVEKLR